MSAVQPQDAKHDEQEQELHFHFSFFLLLWLGQLSIGLGFLLIGLHPIRPARPQAG